MSYNFSEIKKYMCWRWLWVYLCKAQMKLGLPITEDMINEMQENIEEIDFDFIEEKVHKHDVIAHLDEFSSRCPKSASIIHLGATSSYVGDNTDLICLRDALDILIPKLASCINKLSKFSIQYKQQPTMGYTHLNPAQLVTLGRRACLWISDLLNDLISLNRIRERITNNFCGCKSSTGTSDTYLELFSGDKEKVKQLEQMVAELAGFKRCYTVADRKIDVDCLSALASLGCSVHKMCTDIRLLVGLKILEEPFDSSSSHLAHKRNPMKSERCCSLARNLFALNSNALNTLSVQWFERASDDSILRRCTIGEAFLTSDIILNTLQSLLTNLVVHVPIINRIINQELPFLSSCTDKLIDAMAREDRDPEEVRLKLISLQNKANIEWKEKAIDYDLMNTISEDEYFAPIKDQLSDLFNPMNYIGLSVEQVESFIMDEVKPLISQYCKE